MKRTSKYQLGYFEEQDITGSVTETQRWQTIDAELFSVFQVLGNGIIDGWDIISGSDLSVSIADGRGHVDYVAVNSVGSIVINDLTPSTTNYIYATLTDTSYWDQSVFFYATSTEDTSGTKVLLGTVLTDTDSVLSISTDDRVEIGFISTIREVIAAHQHNGSTNNPDPIDLCTETTGLLSPDHIAPLDASKITTGTLDEDRIPLINHITGLINNGTLTHAQIDTLLSNLGISHNVYMGDITTVDFMQMVLRLKHTDSLIDNTMYNECLFMPGVTPAEFIDVIDPAITLDTVNNTFVALPTGVARMFSKTFSVGFAIKHVLLTYEGEIQFGYNSSSFSTSSSTSSVSWSYSSSSNSSSSTMSSSTSSSSSFEYTSSSVSQTSVSSSFSTSGSGSSSSISSYSTSSSSVNSTDSSSSSPTSLSSNSSDSSTGMRVQFAVTGINSIDPTDYTYITPHQIEDVSFDTSYTNLKIMVEFEGYDSEVITLKSFGIMVSGYNPDDLVRIL